MSAAPSPSEERERPTDATPAKADDSWGTWPRGEFLGMPLAMPTVDEFKQSVRRTCEAAVDDGGTSRSILIGYQNAHTSNLARWEPDLARYFREADCIYADGMAIVWGARRHGLAAPERVNAGDFITDLAAEFEHPIRLSLIGGGEGLADAAAEKLGALLPAGSSVWAHHGYLDDPAARDAAVAELREFAPHLLLLGMGSPHQERLAMHLRDTIATPAIPVIWCVGALFEYIAGERYRAPWWVRRIGMEWFVRLALEPGRMWRRYLVGNVVFLWRVATGARTSRRLDRGSDRASN